VLVCFSTEPEGGALVLLDRLQLGKILVLPRREPLDALPIHTHATLSVLGANTLSIRLHHLPPLTPLTRADSIRSVQTEASAPATVRGASAPCAAVSGIPGAVCASVLVVTHPPSYPPSLGPVLLAGLFKIRLDRIPAVLCGL
jgi:hypothetical protein